jgi:hypothetical protein
MQAPAVGSILLGLHRPYGLNADRKRNIIPKSSGVNSFGMKSIFSTPMPSGACRRWNHPDSRFRKPPLNGLRLGTDDEGMRRFVGQWVADHSQAAGTRQTGGNRRQCESFMTT